MAEIGTSAFAGVSKPLNKNVEQKMYPNPALQFIELEFNMATESLVDFAIYDIQGKMVDKMNMALCRAGKNKLRFNIASLAPGTYILKGMDNKGQVMMSDKFIKQ
jgi:hypothetical protein